MDFSGYKIHIPKEKTACSLLEPNESTFPLKESEIFPYTKGIKIILEERRGLWLPNRLMHNKDVKKYFESLGVIAVE